MPKAFPRDPREAPIRSPGNPAMTGRSDELREPHHPLPRSVILDPSDGGSAAALQAPRGTVALLLSGSVDRQWAADAAVELSAEWARAGRRVVLADLHLENPLLHVGLDVSNMEGLVDIFLYGASLSRIARPVRDGAFYLIPSGTYAPDAREIYQHPRWRKLVAGFRESDATLLLFVPGDRVAVSALAAWSREAVWLGPPPDAAMREALAFGGVEVLAVIAPPQAGGTLKEDASEDAVPRGAAVAESVPESGEASADMRSGAEVSTPAVVERTDSPPASRPVPDPELELPPPTVRRRKDRRSTSALLWVVFALIVVGTALYLLFTLRPDLLPAGVTPRGTDAPASGAAESARSSANRLGELLPYSVQVRAFTSLAAAREELATEQRRMGGASFFISPEEIQGILYYKILAGLETDTLGATQLRDRLVEAGSIDPDDAVGVWSLIQFAPLAFDLGEFDSPRDAAVRADSLLERQIPTYLSSVPYSDGTQRWQLYGGAFRDSVSASRMREMLEEVGVDARLTARTGRPPARE